MLYGLLGNINESLQYSLHTTVGRPLFWLGLSFLVVIINVAGYGVEYFRQSGLIFIAVIITIIEFLIDFLFMGFDVNIIAKKDLTFKGFTKTLLIGFKSEIIELIYVGLIFGLFMLIRRTGLFGTQEEIITSLFGQIVGTGFSKDNLSDILSFYISGGLSAFTLLSHIVFILICVLLAIIIILSKVNFALTGRFRDGFNFPMMYTRIKKVGKFKFILGVIIYGIILIVVVALINLFIGLTGFIPNEIVGTILSIIIIALLYSIFIIIFPTRYLANLFVD